MDKAEIASAFKVLVAERLDIDESKISETSTFVELGADSLDQAELLMAAEKKFNFEASFESDDSDIKNVGQAVDFIFTQTR
jgi:acyl carrier protein